MTQTVKNLPVMQETRVLSLGQEDPLEKRMAIHSSIPVWRIPWTEEPGGLQFMGRKESDMTKRLILSLSPQLVSLKDSEKHAHWNQTVLALPFTNCQSLKQRTS